MPPGVELSFGWFLRVAHGEGFSRLPPVGCYFYHNWGAVSIAANWCARGRILIEFEAKGFPDLEGADDSRVAG